MKVNLKIGIPPPLYMVDKDISDNKKLKISMEMKFFDTEKSPLIYFDYHNCPFRVDEKISYKWFNFTNLDLISFSNGEIGFPKQIIYGFYLMKLFGALIIWYTTIEEELFSQNETVLGL